MLPLQRLQSNRLGQPAQGERCITNADQADGNGAGTGIDWMFRGGGWHGERACLLQAHRPTRLLASPGWGILLGFTTFSPESAAPFTKHGVSLPVLPISPMNTSQRAQLLGSLTALVAFPLVTVSVAISRPLPTTTAQPLPVHAVVQTGPDQLKRMLQPIHVPLQ